MTFPFCFIFVCVCSTTHMWGSEDNPQESVLSFGYVGLSDQTQVIQLGDAEPLLEPPVSLQSYDWPCITSLAS